MGTITFRSRKRKRSANVRRSAAPDPRAARAGQPNSPATKFCAMSRGPRPALVLAGTARRGAAVCEGSQETTRQKDRNSRIEPPSTRSGVTASAPLNGFAEKYRAEPPARNTTVEPSILCPSATGQPGQPGRGCRCSITDPDHRDDAAIKQPRVVYCGGADSDHHGSERCSPTL